MEKPFSSAARSSAPVTFEADQAIAERQFRQHVAARDRRTRRIDFSGADAAAVHHRDVGFGCGAHGVGDEVADGGFAAAHGGVAAVEFDGGRAERHVHLARQFLFEAAHGGGTSRSGVDGRRVDDAKIRPPRHLPLAVPRS